MKKKNIVLWVILAVCVCLITGIVYLFGEFFPKAGAIEYPDTHNVISVSLGCNTSDTSIPMSEADIESLLASIRSAKPTRNPALDDTPSTRPYYGVEIKTNERAYRYFIYETASDIYIEIPYYGIYTSNIELLNLVLKYFEE